MRKMMKKMWFKSAKITKELRLKKSPPTKSCQTTSASSFKQKLWMERKIVTMSKNRVYLNSFFWDYRILHCILWENDSFVAKKRHISLHSKAVDRFLKHMSTWLLSLVQQKCNAYISVLHTHTHQWNNFFFGWLKLVQYQHEFRKQIVRDLRENVDKEWMGKGKGSWFSVRIYS